MNASDTFWSNKLIKMRSVVKFKILCVALKDGMKLFNSFAIATPYARVVDSKLQMFSNGDSKVFNSVDVSDVEHVGSVPEFVFPISSLLRLCKSPVVPEVHVEVFVSGSTGTTVVLTYKKKVTEKARTPSVSYAKNISDDLLDMMDTAGEYCWPFSDEDDSCEVVQDTVSTDKTIAPHDNDVFDVESFSSNIVFSFEASLDVVKDIINRMEKSNQGVVTLRIAQNQGAWHVFLEYSQPLQQTGTRTVVKARNVRFGGEATLQQFKLNIEIKQFVKLGNLDIREPTNKKSKIFGNIFFFLHATENELMLCVKSTNASFTEKFLYAFPVKRCSEDVPGHDPMYQP